MKNNKKTQGKKNRAAGTRFELKVRKDLESKGWVVSKWMNNVEFNIEMQGISNQIIPDEVVVGKMIPAKHKFRGPGIPMAIGTGFPDFIAISEKWHLIDSLKQLENSIPKGMKIVYGIEVKSNGYLDKTEKEKCRWLLENHIFSKILIASKGEKRGEIKYKEVKHGRIYTKSS